MQDSRHKHSWPSTFTPRRNYSLCLAFNCNLPVLVIRLLPTSAPRCGGLGTLQCRLVRQWTCSDVANLSPLSVIWHPTDNFGMYLCSIQQIRNLAWQKCVTIWCRGISQRYPYIPISYKKLYYNLFIWTTTQHHHPTDHTQLIMLVGVSTMYKFDKFEIVFEFDSFIVTINSTFFMKIRREIFYYYDWLP